MKRQTYPGKVIWIIVDDCLPRTMDAIADERPNWTIIKVYPEPPWQPSQNTQGRNIAAGINTLFAKYNKEDIKGIFIIEDDDYYKPVYLERMAPRLNGFQATGEKNTIYYNVYYRTYFTNPNFGHSSLFQTAFSIEALPIFAGCINEKFIDMIFWSRLTKVNLFNDGNLSVGIKGITGRFGIGAGHTRLRNMPQDNDWRILTQLIGVEDARLYMPYYGSKQTTSLFKKVF
jgi:hypothetical protein